MKKIALLVMLAAFSFTSFAQQQPQAKKKERPSADEIIKMRVKHMQNALMLDDETSSKFESIYEDYLKDQNKAFEKYAKKKADFNKKKREKSLKDSEVKDMQKDQLEFEKKQLELKETYYEKFSKILNAHQVQKVMFEKKGMKFNQRGKSMFRKGNKRGQVGMHGFRGQGPRMMKPANCNGNMQNCPAQKAK